MNQYHKEILLLIRSKSGKPTQNTFSDGYLGTDHPRYPIAAPALRTIARSWMHAHRDLTAEEFREVLTSLVSGKSSTEKCMVGVLLDAAQPHQRKFNPRVFVQWLDHLEGWAEVDSVCTGPHMVATVPEQWKEWEKVLEKLAKSSNINKQRASLVVLCSPLRRVENRAILRVAFKNIDQLKGKKEILITKAISWLLRSAAERHKSLVKNYLDLNSETLPKIAVRETLTKLRTGRKTKPKTPKR